MRKERYEVSVDVGESAPKLGRGILKAGGGLFFSFLGPSFFDLGSCSFSSPLCPSTRLQLWSSLSMIKAIGAAKQHRNSTATGAGSTAANEADLCAGDGKSIN